MLKQIITGEKNTAVKYHGEVKHLIFECNFCHSSFEKPDSYYRKQLKTRPHACCFCSPTCRSKYVYEHSFETGAKPTQAPAVSTPAPVATPNPPSDSVPQTPVKPVEKKGGPVSNFLRSLFGAE